jgi:hypothetical protein
MKFRRFNDRCGNLLKPQRSVAGGKFFAETLFGHLLETTLHIASLDPS